jgi:hypothetical protein
MFTRKDLIDWMPDLRLVIERLSDADFGKLKDLMRRLECEDMSVEEYNKVAAAIDTMLGG